VPKWEDAKQVKIFLLQVSENYVSITEKPGKTLKKAAVKEKGNER
jgi:hypothetical protein